MFLTVFSTYFHTENIVRNITKLDQIKEFKLSKKAAVASNFSLIGKIPHNFLVPRTIESACKTFMPIQTLDLHRVLCTYLNSKKSFKTRKPFEINDETTLFCRLEELKRS